MVGKKKGVRSFALPEVLALVRINSVERSVLYRFGDVLLADGLLAGEVRNRA